MAVLRRVARPLLASTFVNSGLYTLRHPAAVAPTAAPVVTPIAERVPGMPQDPEWAVRVNSAVQVGAGTLLALGRFPRLSSLALAATLVPTTLAAHAYWTVEDPEERAQQKIHFYKNMSMLGGLLIASADTHGRPSMAHRSRRSARAARRATRPARVGTVVGASKHSAKVRLPMR